MKFFIGVSVVILCLLLGLGISAYYKRRRVFFEDLKNFNLKFLSCIEFSQDPLSEFAGKVKDGFSADFKGLIDKYLVFIENGESGRSCFESYLSGMPLGKGEMGVVSEYFLTLGSCDRFTEREKCEEYKAVFEGLLVTERAEEKKNGALSVKLSVYFGLLVVVLII